MKQNFFVWSAMVGVAFSSSWATVFTPLATDIHEPDGIYYQGDANMLRVDLRTVIGQGPCEVGDYSGCTLDDVNNDTDKYDDFKPEIKVHFQSDDFPDDGKVSNATLRLRGGYSRQENWQNSFEEYYDKVADHTAYGVDNFHVDFDGTPIDNHIVIDGQSDLDPATPADIMTSN